MTSSYETLKKYDEEKAIFLATSILTTGAEDFYGREITKNGRRWVWEFERRNPNGIMVKCHMYVSEVVKALKNGQLEVFAK